MSRTLILAIVIAAIGAGGYFYLKQPEPTPAERLETAAEEAAEAVTDAASSAQDAASDAVDAATEQAAEAASSLADQASEAASSVADQAADTAQEASDQVAALAGQGQELLNCWAADCEGWMHEHCCKLLLDKHGIALADRPSVVDQEGTEAVVFCTKACYGKWKAQKKREKKAAIRKACT